MPDAGAPVRRFTQAVAFFVALGLIGLVGLYLRGPAPLVESGEDAWLRSALVGVWAWSFRDADSGHRIEIRTDRRRDGTWREITTTRSPDGATVDRFERRGRWFAANGVLKTHTLFVDGNAVGRNSRLAFQTYPIESIGSNVLTYRISRENGRPGQWPRVIDRDPTDDPPERVVEERRVPQS